MLAAIGVVPREQDRVGVSDEADVGQGLVGVWSRDLEAAFEVVGRGQRLRSDGVLVHWLFRICVCIFAQTTRVMQRALHAAATGTNRASPPT
jgi:hypothetical protein